MLVNTYRRLFISGDLTVYYLIPLETHITNGRKHLDTLYLPVKLLRLRVDRAENSPRRRRRYHRVSQPFDLALRACEAREISPDLHCNFIQHFIPPRYTSAVRRRRRKSARIYHRKTYPSGRCTSFPSLLFSRREALSPLARKGPAACPRGSW